MWVLSLVLLLASPSFQLPARVLKQRVPKFKNFPVVGIKENHSAEAEIAQEAFVEHPRDARNADAQWNNHDDTDSAAAGQYDGEHLDDTFVEEAIFLTPEAREARALEEEAAPGETRSFDELDAFRLFEDDESVDGTDNARAERDGGHHGGAHHGAHRSGRGRAAAAPVPVFNEEEEYDSYDSYDSYDYEEEAAPRQQQRRGKQTGAVGVALGVLSSPPNSDGNYNFNFSNDDGSSRQEVGAPDAIRGSYSFVSPEGEEVQVQYHADETGFHATGSHVPQAPPMPPHVQRLLDHLAKVNGLERL